MRSVRYILLILLSLICIWAAAGCNKAAKSSQAAMKPVFFPPPPDPARLQFLKAFSGPEDLGSQKSSAFEEFLLGKMENTTSIVKPYGLAMYEGKVYVCDLGRRRVEVLNLKEKTFTDMKGDDRLKNPVNIFIERDGTKYVTDPEGGAVFVFGSDDALQRIIGKDLDIAPMGLAVRGEYCYVTDLKKNQVVVLNKKTGAQVAKIGSGSTGAEMLPGQFSMISDLALDEEGNIYVTDRVTGHITKFDPSGAYLKTYGFRSWSIHGLVRPKGIAVDKSKRIWVIDSAPEVAKIYDEKGELLLYFGLPGNNPGMMNLPAQIILDYNNIKYFQNFAVAGAKLEFLVLVSNNFGLHKINVYGFGSFPQNSADKPSPGP